MRHCPKKLQQQQQHTHTLSNTHIYIYAQTHSRRYRLYCAMIYRVDEFGVDDTRRGGIMDNTTTSRTDSSILLGDHQKQCQMQNDCVSGCMCVCIYLYVYMYMESRDITTTRAPDRKPSRQSWILWRMLADSRIWAYMDGKGVWVCVCLCVTTTTGREWFNGRVCSQTTQRRRRRRRI